MKPDIRLSIKETIQPQNIIDIIGDNATYITPKSRKLLDQLLKYDISPKNIEYEPVKLKLKF